MDNHPQSGDKIRLGIGIAIAAMLWLLTPYCVQEICKVKLNERMHSAGLFDSINALFSGLAFAGVTSVTFLHELHVLHGS